MPLSRRHFLRAAAGGTGALLVPTLTSPGAPARAVGAPAKAPRSAPPLVRQRSAITHGVASGDVRADGALIWTRSDSPATMIVETAATEAFGNPQRVVGPLLTPASDGTGKIRLTGLPAGEIVHYRVILEGEDGTLSEPAVGRFRTAPDGRSDIRLVWTGDCAGQGWGINPDIGGMRAWGTMADREPDLFLHNGDSIYADGPLSETVDLADGRVWRNVVTEAVSDVAQTLEQYRGRYAYNLLDNHYTRFNSAVAQMVQWDDHEVVNNWFPGEVLDDDRYTETDVDTLSGYAWQAFHEWMPLDPSEAVDGRLYRKIAYGPLLDVFLLDMRAYKDDNAVAGRVLGSDQTQWLIEELRASTARWKIIGNDLPIGLIVPDGDVATEGVSDREHGAPGGRESEIASVLSAIAADDITGTVWLSADVHYTAAHRYLPERAEFGDFKPFWEFVTGPINAGAFGPNDLDMTFGPQAVFVHAPIEANTSPLDPEFQHFGEVYIDGETEELTVNLCDGTGAVLYTVTLSE